VADRKPFLLRIDREVLDAVQRWADDDLRSLNGQIEFILRKALSDAKKQMKTDAKKESGKDAKRAEREPTGDEQ
jgi:hypothetical protein